MATDTTAVKEELNSIDNSVVEVEHEEDRGKTDAVIPDSSDPHGADAGFQDSIEDIQALKRIRTTALSAVTKQRNKVTGFMNDVVNLKVVKDELEHYRELYNGYCKAHEAFFSLLEDEEEQDKEDKRFSDKCISIINSISHIKGWIMAVEAEQNADLRSIYSRTSRHTGASIQSVKSVKILEKVKLAELEAEQLMLEKRHTIQKLELEIKLARAKAREDALKELEDEKDGMNAYLTEYLNDRPSSVVQPTSSLVPPPPVSSTLQPTPSLVPPSPASDTGQPSPSFAPLPPSSAASQLPSLFTPSLPATSMPQPQLSSLVSSHPMISTQQSSSSLGIQQQLLPPRSVSLAGQPVDSQLSNLLNASAPVFRPTSDFIAALSLPQPELQKFSGRIEHYRAFIMAFETRVASRLSSAADKLYYLDQHLIGEPKTVISGCFYLSPSEGYVEACKLLEKEYGNPYKVSLVYVKKIQEWKSVKAGDNVNLKKFSLFLLECKTAMKCISFLDVLNHAPNMVCVVQKLPVYLQHTWQKKASRARLEQQILAFDDLVEFVILAAEAANDPVYGRPATIGKDSTGDSKGSKPGTDQFRGKHQTTSMAVTVKSNVSKCYNSKCPLCNASCDIEDCSCYKTKSIEEKRNLLREKKLCFGCFGHNHISKGCRFRRICKVCNKRHPTSLHVDGFKLQAGYNTDNTVDRMVKNDGASSSSTCTATDIGETVVLHAILPVKVFQKGKPNAITTYAFYDNGSNGCFVTNELMEQLQAEATPTTLQLKTMHGCDRIHSLAVNDLIVTDLKGQNSVSLPRSYTREEIPVNHDQIPKREVINQFEHLRNVSDKIPDYYKELPVGILIGSNCSTALEPLAVSPASSPGPFAVRLRHGWTIHGPIKVNRQSTGEITANRIMVKPVEKVKEIMTPLVLDMFERDFCEYANAKYPGEQGLSQEDQRFLQVVENGLEFTDGHYVIPLPFKNDHTFMPNNQVQALKRASSLKKKMLQNAQYCTDYKQFMAKILNSGYAERVPDNSPTADSGQVWYLPHHGVYNINKPGKIRVVFDCSATYQDTSLNRCLLQGPNLANSLVGVLTRFRDEGIAFMADIESMFYQVRVPMSQRSYLRFVWWPDGNLNGNLQEYQMTVHLFGAASSPSVANFALKKAAEASCHPFVKATILENFYVDDCLKSVVDVPTAIDLIGHLRASCQDHGFHLTKFISNDPAVLIGLPDKECAKNQRVLDFNIKESFTERALGVQWKLQTDTFGFSINTKENTHTRRGILSAVSSIYDPLGFISPVILPAKKILQDLCRDAQIDWDDHIPDDQLHKWQVWLLSLKEIDKLAINRSFTTVSSNHIVSKALYAFADASSYGYGAVVYMRLVDDQGNVHVSFLIGKSRLAPIKATTIPKLELTAATTAVRLVQMMKCELLQEYDVTYFTDSTTVLNYIVSDTKRWPVFVANRVQLIRDFSSPSQWQHVSTDDNPADGASRGISASEILGQSQWLTGPKFLYEREVPKLPWLPTDEQYQCDSAAIDIQLKHTDPVAYLMGYFSQWQRLKTAVAVFLMVRRILRDRITVKHSSSKNDTLQPSYILQASEIDSAEIEILKWLQRTSFPDEMKKLSANKVPPEEVKRSRVNITVSKSSVIRDLNPYMDNGLLKVGGRLRFADLDDQVKHPVILPRKSHITVLIIKHIHDHLGHSGRDHVLATLRQRFWVIGANSAVRNVIFHCVKCRRIRSPVSEQVMADLPPCRVAENDPPFTYTGVDYFGPFIIRERRKDLKRYGVIFTCLSSRAVHLEVASSLDTDSFLHALRRFKARRGHIKELYSDNGTNFIGAERELRAALQQMNQDRIHVEVRHLGIKWTFNPPTASNMGGAWERLIRTVRKVLAGLMQEHGACLDIESFHTLLCEVEAIINSRPLTGIVSDVDFEPLTPNHILTGRSNVTGPPPGVFGDADLYVRRRWRRVQYLANLFWSRWHNEYLLLQQRRQKWTQPRRNLGIDDIVLIKDDTLPRCSWLLGRVLATEDDGIGHVRIVTVKTQNSELRRPINKLVLLVPHNP